MLRRRIRSALYIDFENVPLPPEAIANWLAWLEDGLFDPTGRRRRFLQKRVYWNSHAERNRELFRQHGFVPILIGKYSGLKNGADIRMAMDIVETTYTRSEVDEFILLTGDSDFVPVIERLKHKSKRTAIVVTEHRPNIHTTYQRNADLLIPSRRLTEAAQYKRGRSGLLARLTGRKAATVPKPGIPPLTGAAPATAARHSTGRKAQEAPAGAPRAEPPPLLETAAQRVAKLLTQQPRNYVSQKRVLAELDRLQSFKRLGPTAFFGTGSYKALMRELARLEPRITVIDQPGGGTGVVYIPPQSPENRPPPDAMPPSAPKDEAVPPAAPDPAVAPAAVNGARHEPGSLQAALAASAAEVTSARDAPRNGHDTDHPAEPESTPEDEQAAARPRWVAGQISPPSGG